MDEQGPIDVFARALALTTDARRTFLETLRDSDPVVADEVESLLTSHRGAGQFLEAPALLDTSGGFEDADDAPSGTASSDLFADPQAHTGALVGAYRLGRVLGVGGMSVVYTAERADGRFSKTVAIKLVRSDSDAELARRLDRERRLLARLDHPNIARLLDSGETAEGSPFIVMERVDGPPVDRYCDELRLSLEDRLQIFGTICDAVEYARRQGIIHRDLKPSNILVGAGGDVRLLDFGIAKAIEAGGPRGQASWTRTSEAMLSPLYASPEQINGSPVTPATDVYALGILFYELLTGVHPYGDARTLLQVLDTIRQSRPDPPSVAVLSAPGSALTARKGTSKDLSRRLRGDLDNIATKALQPDPLRRYASAGEFSEDVRRHLSNRPVAARPDTLRYRFGKWLLRNRISTLAAATVLLVLLVAAAAGADSVLRLGFVGLLIVAAGAVTILFLRTDEARKTVVRLQHEAERDRARAERVSGFLSDMLTLIDPEVSQGRDTAILVDLLTSAGARIDQELGDQPEVAAEIHLVLHRVYTQLARHDEAFAHAEAAARLADVDPGSDMWFDALVARADMAVVRGDVEDARALLDRCAAVAEEKSADRQLTFLHLSANLHNALGNEAQKEQFLRSAVDVARAAYPADSPQLAGRLQWLGRHLVTKGARAEGEPLLQEAITILSAQPGPLRIEFLRTAYALAVTQIDTGEAAKADLLLRDTLERTIAVWGRDHLESAALLGLLGRAVEATGRPTEAEALYRESLEIARRLFGERHRFVGSAWAELAGFHLAHGRVAESVEEHVQAIRSYEDVVGPLSPLLQMTRRNYAIALLESGRPEAAEPIFVEILQLPSEARPTPPLFMETTDALLGACLIDLGKIEEGRARLASHHDLFTGNTPVSPRSEVIRRIVRSRLDIEHTNGS